MSKIIAIGTAVPAYRHQQSRIFDFMQRVYAFTPEDRRRLSFLYQKAGIDTRYSVLPDYSLPVDEWEFYPASENLEPFPSLEQRMQWYNRHAPALSLAAVKDCLQEADIATITHLITVSCTGMSAPGLDLQLMELLQLPATTFRTSVNFMGCYAAIHALKIADAFCSKDRGARVLIVCTELCTLHFQKENTIDNITSSLLFSDGAAAVLITNEDDKDEGLTIDHFYSAVNTEGKPGMAWELSSTGFTMTLSSYISDLIEKNFEHLVSCVLDNAQKKKTDITHWCIHPGGKKILDAVHNSLCFTNGQLQHSYDVLREYGNMSSATILFVLKRMLHLPERNKPRQIFGAAFGPGLTMETFILSA